MASNEIIVGQWSRYSGRPPAAAKKPKAAKPAKRYVKPAALVEFEKAYNEAYAAKFPKIPRECLARTHFSDKTANALTAAIIAHLEFHGYFAARVNTTGVYDQRRGLYRTTNARKGMADISAIIAGQAVQLEIKAGTDRPRADQLRVQAEYRAAGGVYEFVHNFEEYLALFRTLTTGAQPTNNQTL